MEESDIEHLAALSRIDLSDDEKTSLRSNLSKVLDCITDLQGVDTEGVEPCYRVLQEIEMPMADDEIEPSLETQTFLKNAPAHTGGMVRVPPVLS